MTRFMMTLLAVGILGCSTPKNYYYFDYVRHSSPTPNHLHNESSDVVEATPFHIDPQELTASAEAAPVLNPVTKTHAITKETTKETTSVSKPLIETDGSRLATPATKRELRKELRQTIKAINKHEAAKDIKKTERKKNASKNGFAIAGFVLSLTSLFILWPLAIPGVVFSAMGMKSDKRGLATAGLVIGIVALVLVMAAGAALAA